MINLELSNPSMKEYSFNHVALNSSMALQQPARIGRFKWLFLRLQTEVSLDATIAAALTTLLRTGL